MGPSKLANKNRHAYEMMDGEILSIGWLEEKQISYLENLQKQVKAGSDYFDLLRVIRGVNAMPLKSFGGRVTPQACQSVFFRVAQDIVERAGVAQGRSIASEELKLDPHAELVSMSEAAKLIKRSRTAIHLALTKGTIRGWQVGKAWIVDRNSVILYGKAHKTHADPEVSQA